MIDQLTEAVGELERAGDDARLLVTELGWATGGPAERALVVGEAGQAALIRHTSRLARLADGLRLDGMFYFNWRDVSAAPGARDHWGPTGPLAPGRVAKAGARGAAAGRGRLAGTRAYRRRDRAAGGNRQGRRLRYFRIVLMVACAALDARVCLTWARDRPE